MAGDLVLAKLDRAVIALREANTPQAVKQIVDIATAAETYAKRQKLGEEAIGHAHAIKTYALVKLGEMLKEGPKNKGAKGSKVTGTKQEPVRDATPTLSDLGLDKKTSSMAQKLAALPKKQREAVASRTTTVTKAAREVAHASRPATILETEKKYRVLYADPPWNYGNSGLQQYGHASHHYPTMSVAELCALPVKAIAEDDSVLFLWVTSPLLDECWPVIKAWGFTYKTSFVWDKIKHNFGHYNSVRHELLLVCTRGSCTPDVKTLHDSVVSIERAEHSAKPEEFRAIIEDIYTKGKRIELFARSKHSGWATWGNEPKA